MSSSVGTASAGLPTVASVVPTSVRPYQGMTKNTRPSWGAVSRKASSHPGIAGSTMCVPLTRRTLGARPGSRLPSHGPAAATTVRARTWKVSPVSSSRASAPVTPSPSVASASAVTRLAHTAPPSWAWATTARVMRASSSWQSPKEKPPFRPSRRRKG